MIPPRAGLVQRARHQLFTRTGRTCDQHADVERSNAPGLLQHACHGRAAGQHVVLPVVFKSRQRHRQRLVNGLTQGFFINWLGEKAKHTGTSSRHGIGNGAMGSHNYHRQPHMLVLNAIKQCQAVHAVHTQITEHQFGPVLLQPFQRFGTGVGRRNFKAFTAQP